VTLQWRVIWALIFLRSAGDYLYVEFSVHFLHFQVRSLQDESVSVCTTSLWLQLEFTENRPMSSGVDRAKEQGTLLLPSLK